MSKSGRGGNAVALYALGANSAKAAAGMGAAGDQGNGLGLEDGQDVLPPEEIDVEGAKMLGNIVKRMNGVQNRIVAWERDGVFNFISRDGFNNQADTVLSPDEIEALVTDSRHLLLLDNKPELIRALLNMAELRPSEQDAWVQELYFVPPPRKSAKEKEKEANKRASSRRRKDAILEQGLRRARQQYEQQLFLRPHDVRIMIRLGYAHCDLGDVAAGAKMLQRAADAGASSDFDGRFWRTLGRAHYLGFEATGDPSFLEKAQEAYSEAIRHIENLGNASVWFETSRVYVRFGSFEGALQNLAQIIKNFPSFERMPEVLWASAMVLKHMKLYGQAIAYLQHLLDDPPPQYPPDVVLFQLARVYELQGDLPLAREAYTDLFAGLKRRGNVGRHSSLRAWLSAADTFQRFGDMFAEQQDHLLASDAYAEALSRAIQPDAALWFSLALSAAGAQELQKAVVCAQNALALDPSNPEVRTMLKRWAMREWTESFETATGHTSAAARDVQRLMRKQQAALRERAQEGAPATDQAASPGRDGTTPSAQRQLALGAAVAAVDAEHGGNVGTVDPLSIGSGVGPRRHVPPEHQSEDQARMVEGLRRIEEGYGRALDEATKSSQRASTLASIPVETHKDLVAKVKAAADERISAPAPSMPKREKAFSESGHLSFARERVEVTKVQAEVLSEMRSELVERDDEGENEAEEHLSNSAETKQRSSEAATPSSPKPETPQARTILATAATGVLGKRGRHGKLVPQPIVQERKAKEEVKAGESNRPPPAQQPKQSRVEEARDGIAARRRQAQRSKLAASDPRFRRDYAKLEAAARQASGRVKFAEEKTEEALELPPGTIGSTQLVRYSRKTARRVADQSAAAKEAAMGAAAEEAAMREAWAEEVGAFVVAPRRRDWRVRKREAVGEIRKFGAARSVDPGAAAYSTSSAYVRDWRQLLVIAARHFRNQSHLRRDLARCRPRPTTETSQQRGTGSSDTIAFMALADACGLVEAAARHLEDRAFVAEARRLEQVIDVPRIMGGVPRSTADPPGKALQGAEEEDTRHELVLQERRRVSNWLQEHTARLSDTQLEAIIRRAHVQQTAATQSARADGRPVRAGGDALRRLLEQVQEDARLAHRLPVHLSGADRGVGVMSASRMTRPVSGAEIAHFLSRHSGRVQDMHPPGGPRILPVTTVLLRTKPEGQRNALR